VLGIALALPSIALALPGIALALPGTAMEKSRLFAYSAEAALLPIARVDRADAAR